MSARWERPAASLIQDLKRIFAARLHSVVVYGPSLDETSRSPLTSMALVTSLTQEDLDECARLAAGWLRQDVDTPLILPLDEFRRSLDTFPLEYSEILATHARVFGPDPFEGVVIGADDVRRACEKQVKSHLLHLREGYIEAKGDPQAISQLVVGSAPAFAVLLRNVAVLLGLKGETRTDTALSGAHALGLDSAVVRLVVSSADTSARSSDGARLFPGYLTAVEKLAHAVDTWRS